MGTEVDESTHELIIQAPDFITPLVCLKVVVAYTGVLQSGA